MEITAIHKEFHSILHNYIAKRIKNRSDVDDLLQEVFIKIHKSGSSLSKKESLKSWIFTLTKNTIIDHYRKNGNTKIILDERAVQTKSEEAGDFDRTKSLERCIPRFINELPEGYRQLIIDSEISGIKQKDLAEKYELAYPSVRSRVQRGRAKLKEMFLDCCEIALDKRGNILDAVPKSKPCK